MRVVRFMENPIIRPNMDGRMGTNINGPSLIQVPEWIEHPLGKYYLYFGHHGGQYIRLAYADRLEGPWRTYEPGVLDLADSYCVGHLASPDVHVDNEARRLRLYYHGPVEGMGQRTKVALSSDGLLFNAREQDLGTSYFRVWVWKGFNYAIGMPGRLYRSRDGIEGFEEGPTLFTPNMRHSAVLLRDHTLYVFYSNAFDCPERILMSSIELEDDWEDWRETEPETVLEPEDAYEGVDCEKKPSARGWSPERTWQLRDPGIYQEADKVFLLYSVAGENGIGIAGLHDGPWSSRGTC